MIVLRGCVQNMMTRMQAVRTSLVLLLLASFACCPRAERRSLLADTILGQPSTVPISSGAVRESNMDEGVPAGRTCVASGMSCSSNSQCCSKSCDEAFFRCQ